LYCPQKKQKTYDELIKVLISNILPGFTQFSRDEGFKIRFGIHKLSQKKQLSSHQIKGSDTLSVAEFYLKEETGNQVTGGR